MDKEFARNSPAFLLQPVGSHEIKEILYPNDTANTLIDTLARIISSRTEQGEQQVLNWFAEDSDNLLNWLLRDSLPSDYCFDGLKYVLSRTEDSYSVRLISTIWYLANGDCLSAALQFDAEAIDARIHYRYSIVPERAYPSYDKMWAELLLLFCGDPSSFVWPESTSGVIVPESSD